MTTARTQVDFTQHELKVIKTDEVIIYDFYRPNSKIHGLTFINSSGIMAVTGDFGNWIFCREFHLGGKGHVSGGYMDEKLEILSVQKSEIYDPEETLKDIQNFKDTYEDMYGVSNIPEDVQDWLDELQNVVYDEHEYVYVAYRKIPSGVDYEDVPFGKIRHRWLDAVYDAFEAMNELYVKQQSI